MMELSVFRARLITAILIAVIGAVTLWQSNHLPFGAINNIRAGFFPKIFGTLLLVLSVLMLVDLLRKRKKEVAESKLSSEETAEIRGAIFITGIFLLFFLFNYLLGYIVATLLSVGLLGYLLGLKGWKLVLLAAGTSLVIWLLFQQWMDIRLPSGIWF